MGHPVRMLFQNGFYPSIGWIGVLAAAAMQLTSQPTQPLYGLRARHTTKEITLLRRIYSNDSAIGLHHVPKDI